MSYQKRISFQGVAKYTSYGLPYNPKLCFWVADVADRHTFYVRYVEYDDIEDLEFIGDMSKLDIIYWYDGVCDGFAVSHDTNRIRLVVVKNNDLVVQTLDDYNFEAVGTEIVIKPSINASFPVIFYRETDVTQNLVIISKMNGIFDAYRTDDWITFNKTNLIDMIGRWDQYLLSTTTDVTLEEYLDMNKKVFDVYNSL